MDVFTACYCFPISLCKAEVYVYETPDLTIFDSRSVIFDNYFWVSMSYTWVTSSRFERIDVFWVICSWWCHVVTCFDLTILESLISIEIYYWDTFWLLIGEPLDIVIYHWCLQMLIEVCCDHDDYYLMLFSCSWITNVIIVAYLLMLSNPLYRSEVIFWFLISWA